MARYVSKLYLVRELFCCEIVFLGDFSCLKVKLHFTRDKAFYWTTVFIPGAVKSPVIFIIEMELYKGTNFRNNTGDLIFRDILD